MTDIHRFNRFELKYVIALDAVEAFKKDILKYVQVDANGNNGQYRLESLYYDTEDHQHYWEKIEGLKYRRKIRIRRYVTDEKFDESSKVYVEIKQRIDRVTQKRRVSMSYGEAKYLLEEGIYPKDIKSKDKEIIDELYHLSTSQKLIPSAITCYDRQAYFGTENDIGLRITFDTSVGYMHKNLDLKNIHPEGLMVPPKFCILEIKADDKVPYWVTELIANHNFKLIRVSKYCLALEESEKFPKSAFNLAGKI
ncbi:polyphosphate polymerase domain-containing protein [Candidatus Gracilibacteria bacterium]|nr:polyphosphate polymerase domain-containing protein [Candidatus Gracilibacteria bacterium]